MVIVKCASTGGYHALKPYPFIDVKIYFFGKLAILPEIVMSIARQKYSNTKEAATYHKIP